ncbi:hypothetical protein IX51_01315 [uncultured archaeon]|nr:hypothetical protein IX51_01315 [uncultured archaeon]
MQTREETIKDAVDKILALDESENIEFIFLYGSVAIDKAHKGSDIDLCIRIKGTDKEAFDFVLQAMSVISSDLFDIKLFRQLPLYIKIEVFKGKLLYSRDMQQVYLVAYETIEDYDEFRPRFFDYIGKEAIH